MATDLPRFRDAFASLTYAVYEPLIVRWYSALGLAHIAGTLAARRHIGQALDAGASTALRLDRLRLGRVALPTPEPGAEGPRPLPPLVLAPHLEPARLTLTRASASTLAGANPDLAYMATAGAPAAAPQLAAVPVIFNTGTPVVSEAARRAELEELISLVRAALARPDGSPSAAIAEAVAASGYHFFPETLEEALSPIGIAHYYRQLFFAGDEGVGALEQAFTIAPQETFEISYETVRRQTREETLEIGSESVSERASEDKESDELSDKVATMSQRDSSMAISASASGSIGVWGASASASVNSATSSQRSAEQASQRVREMTKRASERMTRTFKVTSARRDDLQTSNLTRRTIRNETAEPTSYGLRRVLTRQRVKVQALGPRLVWQVFVRDPGAGLARSALVRFVAADQIASANPPNAPPEPQGGHEDGHQVAVITPKQRPWKREDPGVLVLRIAPGSHRDLTSVQINAITNLEGDQDEVSVPLGEPPGLHLDEASHTWTVTVGVRMGETVSVAVDYTFSYEPSASARARWQQQRDAAAGSVDQQGLQAQFERERDLITMRSKITPRAAADLRREERYETMSRIVEVLFGRAPGQPTDPTPLEIEAFHRYFEVSAAFLFMHPSWWRPRYHQRAGDSWRRAYEITDESQAAPMGASLGWELQLDGDSRRNEFLNSPWVRACLPIRVGQEREALAWLTRHADGDLGFDAASGSIADLLADLDRRRAAEGEVEADGGADWVTVDSTTGAPSEPRRPEAVYPLVGDFEVVVPTEGFVFERLRTVP